MSAMESVLRERYRGLETEELLALSTRDLTDEAQAALAAELAARKVAGQRIAEVQHAAQAKAAADGQETTLSRLRRLLGLPAGGVLAAADRPVVAPATWERVLAWLLLLYAAFRTLNAVRVLVQLPPDYLEAFSWAFWTPFLLMNLLLGAGLVMLVRMSRWALPLVFAHLVLVVLRMLMTFGLKGLGGAFVVGVGLEALVLVFCLHLLAQGKLR